MKLRTISVIWKLRKQKTTNQEKKKKRTQNNKDSVSSLWDNFKRPNICIIRITEGEKKEQETGNLFEKIMKENSPDWVKEIDIQVLEAQRVPNKMDTKRTTPRHIISKLPKFKDNERTLKATREKQLVTYMRNSHKTVRNFAG